MIKVQKQPRGRHPTHEENKLWLDVTKSVRRASRKTTPAIAVPQELPKKQKAKLGLPGRVELAPHRATAPKPEKKTTALGTGIDGGTAKRMQKGQLQPEAALDLHGMTQARAHMALESFLRASAISSLSCVLVVTGKGKSKQATNGEDAAWMRSRTGILKDLVPLWLEQSSTRSHIAAVRNAHPRHGGSGALYIYLRTKNAS